MHILYLKELKTKGFPVKVAIEFKTHISIINLKK